MSSSPSYKKLPRGRSAEPQPLLTLEQVQSFFQTNPHGYGLFLSLDEAAEISGNTPGTLRKHVSEGIRTLRSYSLHRRSPSFPRLMRHFGIGPDELDLPPEEPP